MNSYPWLEESITQWHEMVFSDAMPHAILLSGVEGSGKLALAKLMAQYAMCENLSTKGVCQKCSGCELLKVGNHTDLIHVMAEKSVIKIEQIRQLSKKVTLTATRNKYKVVIIENAEQMNKSSANALLKTLEEPPNKVIIILTTNDIGKLLPTIKSRCIKLVINTPTYKESQRWLCDNVKDKNTKNIEMSLTLSNNAPLLAKKILETDTIFSVKEMLADMQLLTNNQKTILEIQKKWFKNEWYYLLNYIAIYFLKVLKVGYSIDIKNTKIFELEGSGNIGLMTFIKKTHELINYTKTSLKVELLLEDLLITWKTINN